MRRRVGSASASSVVVVVAIPSNMPYQVYTCQGMDGSAVAPGVADLVPSFRVADRLVADERAHEPGHHREGDDRVELVTERHEGKEPHGEHEPPRVERADVPQAE